MSDVRVSAASPSPGRVRRNREVPGCLKSESEERETWTAESLRAASSNAEGFRTEFLLREKMRPDETSAVDVSGQHYGFARSQSGTSSNVVTCREKVLIQLESLILAQSERWRQA